MQGARTPEKFHSEAIAAERAGDVRGALDIMSEGIKQHESNAALINSAGSLSMRSGDIHQAERWFARAAGLEPENLEFALNRAIALERLGEAEKAVQLLRQYEAAGAETARYWSVRANAERSMRALTRAARAYDKCTALEPGHAKALHGRARVALERSESDALARFDRALAVNSGEPDLWLGKAQALDLAGDNAGARQIMEQVAAQAPGWLEGLKFLAQLRLGAGEADFTAPYVKAAQAHSADPNIPAAHAEVLAGLDYHAAAAEVAASARKRFAPQEAFFAFLEAVHAGSAGQWDRAEAIFAKLDYDGPDRALHEARHRIRGQQIDAAERLLDEAMAQDPWSISAWALRGIVWRLRGDAKAQWLHEQSGLVQSVPLCGADDLIERSAAFLRELHEGMPTPLGQSLRGGSQTRGLLFSRTEALIRELRQAVLTTLERYRESLPKADPAHPLLRRRECPLALEGSWSVRLTGGGDHHTAHIHPQGLVSSALYLVVPSAADEAREPSSDAAKRQAGWLEIGRPPPDLGLDLPPLKSIQPKAGTLALFPSTLYHGTRPFGDGERMTVAFDAAPRVDRLQ